jgi:hypothetical protein
MTPPVMLAVESTELLAIVVASLVSSNRQRELVLASGLWGNDENTLIYFNICILGLESISNRCGPANGLAKLLGDKLFWMHLLLSINNLPRHKQRGL